MAETDKNPPQEEQKHLKAVQSLAWSASGGLCQADDTRIRGYCFKTLALPVVFIHTVQQP